MFTRAFIYLTSSLMLFCIDLLAQSEGPPTVVVLGTMQDGGSPHMGCTKPCCTSADPLKKVVSLGLIDPVSKKKFLFEATPDIVIQTHTLNTLFFPTTGKTPDGIFITHAHIGHYSGLQFLGKEAMNARSVPVYTLPRMGSFIKSNGPWSQLVQLNNISIEPIEFNKNIQLSPAVSITPLQVPHRDEFSETAGYLIEGPRKKLLFIPDIDKWEKWDNDIVQWVKKVDFLLIDGTFFNAEEVGFRNIKEIPHPLVEESIEKFKDLSPTEKNKIIFIHFNHTNPLLNNASEAAESVKRSGFKLAFVGMQMEL